MSGIPKGERKPKIQEGTNLEKMLLGVPAGWLIANFSTNLLTQAMGLLIAGSSALLFADEFIDHMNPYRTLFENLGMVVGDRKVPRYKGKKKTPYGYSLSFTLPAGLSTENFEKNQVAIEQNLGKRIDINYKNKKAFIRVYEKDLQELEPYRYINCGKPLEYAFALTHGAKPITIDFSKHIHILIAGETGGGKSTLLRTLITSIILSNTKVELYLIDLKNGVEFNVFRKSNKVKSFCRNIDEAYEALDSLIEEVDKRYELLYDNNVENLEEYNKLNGVKRLGYKVCFIDEFADLQEEEDCIRIIAEIGRKARACGIHMVISTQRPSKEVVNGSIKANFTTKIGLKTSTSINSRIIIDENGLEKLRGVGHGMMKFSELTEFQTMYLSMQETKKLIQHTYVEEKPKKVPPIVPIGVIR